MAVGIECDRYRGMAQHLRHLLGVHVATKQQARGRVPEIVEPHGRKTRDCQERPQFAVELYGMQVTTRCPTEHEVAIDPERPGVQALLDLAASMLAKRVNSEGSDLHPAARPR
jgi:hypothetical protein